MSKNSSAISLKIGSSSQIKQDYPCNKLCWFKVGGTADYYYKPANESELSEFIIENKGKLQLYPIGAGSNVIFRDSGVRGALVRAGRGFNYIKHDDKGNIIAGASVLDLNLAIYCRDHSITGLEFFAGIPGTIGGAIAMNAGAYGQETKDVLVSIRAVNLETGEIREFKTSEIDFAYRFNPLTSKWFFTEAAFKTEKGDQQEIANKIAQIQTERSKTQPIKTKTGGSTFKNPEGNKAWKLIDAAGCRGLRFGGCHISELHCNFIVNDKSATASDIINLIANVRAKVLKNSGVTLETEIKII